MKNHLIINRFFVLFFCGLLLFASSINAEESKQPRKKIGLVLGGGGALGLAHIGVLKVLEEQKIPIDYITGTSMGAIVAGMYASGMSPDEIEERFITINWWSVLKDRSPYPFLDYRKKKDYERFMGLEFGIKKTGFVFPPGMSYGQKLNNVLETFSIDAVGISDFDKLNIPYRALASDLLSGKSVVLKSGNLAMAMRASMAVPGVFTPVRTIDGMILIDGGILNNIPVNVAKDMGADIIIAVDVGASSAQVGTNENFQSLMAVTARTYSLMKRPNEEQQLKDATLVVAPDLGELNASQFHKVSEIIPCGYRAANKMKEQLKRYSVDDKTFQTYLKKQRKDNVKEITVREIKVKGSNRVPIASIKNRIKTKPGVLDIQSIQDDLNRIHGMGDFQTVTYDLAPTTNGYELAYIPVEKFWGPGYLRFGTKIELATDSTFLWSILLNYTKTQLNDLNGEVLVDLELGGYRRMTRTEWYQPVTADGRFFIAPSLLYSNEDSDFYSPSTHKPVADINEEQAYARVDLGVSFSEYGEARIGLQGGRVVLTGSSGFVTFDEEKNTLVGAKMLLRLDQLDEPIFSTSGYQLSVDGFFSFSDLGSSTTYSTLECTAKKPLTFGAHTLLPKISMGSSLGSDLPFYALFDVGGMHDFAGMAPYQMRGNYYGIGSLGYLYQISQLPPTLGGGLFFISRVDAGNAWYKSSEIALDNISYGGLVGFGAHTIVGTCFLAVGKAESIDTRFYFLLGNTF